MLLWRRLHVHLHPVRLGGLCLGHTPQHMRHPGHLGLRAELGARGGVRAMRALRRPRHGMLHGEKRLPAGRADEACRGAVVHGVEN